MSSESLKIKFIEKIDFTEENFKAVSDSGLEFKNHHNFEKGSKKICKHK